MRIAINCRSFLLRHPTGIGRYTSNLVRCLEEIDKGNEYYLYAKKGIFDSKRTIPKVASRNFLVKIDRLNRGLDRTLGKVDVYHSPSPDSLNISHARIVVTVHDFVYKAYPQGHTPQTLQTTEQQFRDIVAKASKIICCSENTRRDLHQYFKLDKEKSCVIYQGVDKEMFYPLSPPQRDVARGAIEAKGVHLPFILFVGTVEPRKNLANLIRAYALLKEQKKFDGQLVCIGMQGWMSEDMSGLRETLESKNDILFLGYLTNEELRYFYNMAEVFAFPSFYEGFGFPILEAFSCGAAVVTSNVSSCPEIAQDAALKIDPFQCEEIASAIERILTDSHLKSELKQRALKRAGDFSFLDTARKTLDVYKKLADS